MTGETLSADDGDNEGQETPLEQVPETEAQALDAEQRRIEESNQEWLRARSRAWRING